MTYTPATDAYAALELSRPGTLRKNRAGPVLVSLVRIGSDLSPRTSSAESTSSSERANSEGTVSFLTKIRKTIHTTPVLRQVSKSWADTFGMSKAYAEFDAKIGYSESGEPVPADAGQYSSGFGRQDLADYATERYPNLSTMVGSYRQYERATGRARRVAMPAQLPEFDEDYDQGDDLDYPDEEEE